MKSKDFGATKQSRFPLVQHAHSLQDIRQHSHDICCSIIPTSYVHLPIFLLVPQSSWTFGTSNTPSGFWRMNVFTTGDNISFNVGPQDHPSIWPNAKYAHHLKTNKCNIWLTFNLYFMYFLNVSAFKFLIIWHCLRQRCPLETSNAWEWPLSSSTTLWDKKLCTLQFLFCSVFRNFAIYKKTPVDAQEIFNFYWLFGQFPFQCHP